jgi:fatty-acyl-CoA synthase
MLAGQGEHVGEEEPPTVTHWSTWSDISTLGDVLVGAANKWPDQLAAVDETGRRTYAELVVASELIADQLLERGITHGSRVGILMPNSIEAIEAIFACTFVGAVGVIINTRFSARELRHVIEDSQVDLLLVSGMRNSRVDFEKKLVEALPMSSDLSILIFGRDSDQGWPRLQVDPTRHTAGLQSRVDESRARVSVRAGALIIYTSGTTSLPKGCVLTHESVVRAGITIGRSRLELVAEDRVWAPLPIFHIGFFVPMIATLNAGAAVLTQAHFDAPRLLDAIVDEMVTVCWSVFPALNDGLLAAAADRPGSLDRVRLVVSVAPPEAIGKLQKRLPNALVAGAYGSTETGGICVMTERNDPERIRTHTQGRPLPGVEVVTVDPANGEVLERGEPGEIAVRGWSTFAGYWQDPAQTEAVLTASGFVRTGDLGVLDEAGHLTFTGRIKDMIKVGGENVAALEIESVLVSHPRVAVAAVVGIPDERLGEIPVAFVERAPGAVVDADEVQEYCAARLARYKVPRHVRFVTEWPMSATKIKKRELIEHFE